MSKTMEIEYNLSLNVEAMSRDIRRLEISLMRIGSYIQRFSGNQDLNSFVDLVMKAINALRALQIAIRATQLAYAGAGPIGWLYAGVSLAGAGIIGYTMFQETTGV